MGQVGFFCGLAEVQSFGDLVDMEQARRRFQRPLTGCGWRWYQGPRASLRTCFCDND
jgi:hypothetical protein